MDNNQLTATKLSVKQNGYIEGIEAAIKFVRERCDNYIQEHGSYDPETGATEFPGNGDETVEEWEEIIEGIEALKQNVFTDHEMTIINTDKELGPYREFGDFALLNSLRNVIYEWEKLPAHPQQTAVVQRLSDAAHAIQQLQITGDYSWPVYFETKTPDDIEKEVKALKEENKKICEQRDKFSQLLGEVSHNYSRELDALKIKVGKHNDKVEKVHKIVNILSKRSDINMDYMKLVLTGESKNLIPTLELLNDIVKTSINEINSTLNQMRFD